MASSSWKKWPDHVRDKWRDDLRDIEFWFNGYRQTRAYMQLYLELQELLMSSWPLFRHNVVWNVGVGPMASFTRAICLVVEENLFQGEFKHVIRVDLKPTATAEEDQGTGFMSTKYQLAVAAAKELGLLDQAYNRLKEKHDQLQYYAYGWDDGVISKDLAILVRYPIVHQIGNMLSTNKYLLLAENLQWSFEPGSLTRDCGLPPPEWTDSLWCISATSHEAYKKSKSERDQLVSIDKDEYVAVLTLSAMHQSAEHILNMTRQESKEYWHHIALKCFHYAMVIFAKHSVVAATAITSDELIHQWAAQGILPGMCFIKEEETSTISSKCSHMHRVGRVILEAFQKYSLLQLPFSPAAEAYEAFNTGAQFFLYHGLIAEGITDDELFDDNKEWISFPGDHGWHVSREWLSPEERKGATALILRDCSHQSLILSKLDSFLPKLCFLRVLDISYTPIKSLPSSIGCLINLRLLSLRGCHGLKTLSCSTTISPTDSSTNTTSNSPLSTLYLLEILDMNGVPFSHLTQDVSNQKWNLIHLDMSYSQIASFPPDFFQDMSNLEELILTSCSNLVELPPSMASLYSLTTLVVIRTQIKYFPQKIFEEMQKLQSLKLIDNKNLVSLTRQISRVQIIKLEGHPSLISFMLIGAPHIRHLSLRGCKKLESVEIKNLGALEELDLSGTAIKELPADIPNIPQLRRLLLLGVPSLRRFPWHRLDRLPVVFYLDHCSEENGNHSNQISHVCVTDPKFFHSFGNTAVDLVREGRFLQSFYVRVAPCITNNMHLQDEEGMLNSMLQELVKRESTYVDVYRSFYAHEIAMVPPVTIPLRRSERHMDISGKQSTLDGLRYLLIVTKSISVTCASSIDYFPWDVNFQELEECELRWCHKMTKVFTGTEGLKKLRNLHVCNLKSLDSLCEQDHHCTFSSLQHLHLEDCPRLKYVVPHTARLPCLKTIDILFCYNLKTIFVSSYYQLPSLQTIKTSCSATEEDTYYQLPSLQTIRLQELPLLQHFHSKDATITAPVWNELHVRGCWSLRHLPRLQGRQLEAVKVNGERRWWSKLQWGSPLHLESYDPKLPPEFASFDERAEMSSYLR